MDLAAYTLLALEGLFALWLLLHAGLLTSKRAAVLSLVMLAAADDRLTDSEMAVLLAVASRENITPEEFNRVMEDPDSVNIQLPEDEDTKLAYLRDMVAMMMIDGELDEHELAICKLYAMALGYRGIIVDGMIAGVIESLDDAAQEQD